MSFLLERMWDIEAEMREQGMTACAVIAEAASELKKAQSELVAALKLVDSLSSANVYSLGWSSLRQQARAFLAGSIQSEILRFKVVEDPTMPPGSFELRVAPQHLRGDGAGSLYPEGWK